MTKDEIKKALEICTDIYAPCNGCPYEKCTNCDNTLHTDALNVIVEQEKEIELLKDENCELTKKLEARLTCDFVRTAQKHAEIDILNEVKKRLDSAPNGWAYTGYIDDLIEEVEKQ